MRTAEDWEAYIHDAIHTGELVSTIESIQSDALRYAANLAVMRDTPRECEAQILFAASVLRHSRTKAKP